MARTCVLAAATLALMVSTSLGKGRAKPSSSYEKVMQVVNSAELSKDQKIAGLKELAGADQTRMTALVLLDRLDFKEAMATARSAFVAKDTPREVKLRLGHFMLERHRPRRAGFPKAFVKEFARYLVGAVLDGGAKEFCQKVDRRSPTAVGEYAYLAGDFDGYKEVDFTPFKDARVAAVLIRCLDAPDNVYPKDPVGCDPGKPGESTGRNTARQQIPVALARLGAAQATDPLRKVLLKHHDWYLRDNAAYALARLANPADHAVLITQLLSKKAVNAQGRTDFTKDRYHHLYAFGRGLLHRGDDGGIEFMAFKYSTYNSSDGLSQTVYMLAQRVNDLKDTRSPKLAGFFKQAFDHERVMGVLLQDKTKVKVDEKLYSFAKATPRIEGLFDRMCQTIERNRLVSLRPRLEQIAKHSASETIRHRAEQCAARLKK